MSLSINCVRPLQRGKVWRWHSKSRSARIASDSHYRPISLKRVNCVAKGRKGSSMTRLCSFAFSQLIIGTVHRYFQSKNWKPVCVTSSWHNIAVWFAHFSFRFFVCNLRSTSQRKMIVPRYRLDSYGRRSFAIADPSTWNSLPDSLRDPALSLNILRRHLKTHFLGNIDETYSAH